jgi:hypothetical protein
MATPTSTAIVTTRPARVHCICRAHAAQPLIEPLHAPEHDGSSNRRVGAIIAVDNFSGRQVPRERLTLYRIDGLLQS